MQLGVNEIDEQRVGEEDGQQIVGVTRMKIRVVEKGIRSGQETAWDMDYLQIEVCKIKQPSSLAAVEVLDLAEVHQVLVVSKDLDT